MSPPTRPRFLIIGAGPTGLGAAYRLRELGIDDFLVVDADSQVGGLAKSFRDPQGFWWDIGGHVQFSHYPYFDALMNRAIPPEGWWNHQRESWVWMRERFIPYPLQNNLRYLPKEELWKGIQGLLALRHTATACTPKSFREWIDRSFGAGIAESFMLPYNFKVWATPAEEMSYNWIGERVAVLDLERILRSVIFETDDLSWGPNNTFRFPKQGGTGAIWEAVARLVGLEKISLRNPVLRIDGEKRTAMLGDGRAIRFEHCLSTMPIDQLVARIGQAPESLRARAAELKRSSSNIVGIGLGGEIPEGLNKKCWMYFPESNCPFYRATVFSHYSPQNLPVPGEGYSLMLEVSESEYKPVDHAHLMAEVEEGLRATRLMGAGNAILSRWQYRAAYGYPVPSRERDAILEDLHPFLERHAIFSRGRFGGWKYEVSNQDHSCMQGVEWVNRILHGEAEATYFGPGAAAAKKSAA